jgi:hypothetical protein
MEQRGNRGFRPIGSLTPRIANTPPAGDTTPPGSQNRARPSAITTTSTELSREIGTPRGVSGSGSLTSLRAEAKVRADTLERDPAALLQPSVQSVLAAKWAEGDTRHGWDGYAARYELVGELPAADLEIARQIGEEMLRPTREDIVLAELRRLRAVTASREIGQDTLALTFAAYADELLQYPADAVRTVLREWPRSNRFWPSMAELIERLERLVTPRRALREALRRGYQPRQDSPDPIPPTAEEKEAVAALLQTHGIGEAVQHRERASESKPMTAADRKRVADETAGFRMVDSDDPGVREWLRKMGVDP